MKYVILVLFLAAVFGLCLLIDRGIGKVQAWAQRRPVVRLPLRYPVLSLLLLIAAPFSAWYGLAHAAPQFLAGAALLAGTSLYAIWTYGRTGIDYTSDHFTFRAGRSQKTFRYSQIQGQRVAISPRKSCLVLCTDQGNVVLDSNMQGFTAFLDAAYAGWCHQNGLDPQNQDWHDPKDHRWFPDQPDETD